MHFIYFIGVLFCAGLVVVVALNPGEVTTLKDMQREWGSQLGWTGSPSCNWKGVICDSDGHIAQL